MLFDALIYAGVVPLATAALVAIILGRSSAPIQIAWPVAITAGFLAAQVLLRGNSSWAASLHTFIEPREAIDWLPHILLLALGVSVVIHLAPARRVQWFALAAALCVAVPVRLLSGNVAAHWPAWEKLAWLAALATALG